MGCAWSWRASTLVRASALGPTTGTRRSVACRRRRSLDVLFIGSLPPHNGGSAIVDYQLVVGLARVGHQIRALAPATREVVDHGDEFASTHREVEVHRFQLPGLASFPTLLDAPKELRRR